MDADLPPATAARIRSLSAEGRARFERALQGRPSRAERVRIAALRAVGACAIGLLAAGVSLLATVVVLNLVTHYSP